MSTTKTSGDPLPPAAPQVLRDLADRSVEAEMSHATAIEPSPEPLSNRRWQRYKVNRSDSSDCLPRHEGFDFRWARNVT